MSDWIDETPIPQGAERDGATTGESPGEGLTLTAKGVSLQHRGQQLRARWEQVFGVALVPEEAPRRAYILVPRRPPAPPWIEVRPHEVKGVSGGFQGLERLVRQRVAQSGYRDRGPSRPQLSPAELMRRVLARADVPGALEVPVGAGPGGWWRRSLDVVAAGGAGGLCGLCFSMMAAPSMALGIATITALGGASVPVLTGSNWRALRGNQKPRVLVLAPDGCVVGLPSGPAVFGWDRIARFAEGFEPPPHNPGAAPRSCLEIELTDGAIAGRIDAAWFAQPMSLMVAVAEAYRSRHS